MRDRRPFIRNFDAWARLQTFLVSAVASVMAIRLFLGLTGYPQVGGAGLHVAHMLWGGLLMLAAIVVLLSFVGRAAERAAALAGGVGFGTFIDELGKFVTSDHDYFFRPAVAMIYVTFVLLFLAARSIHTRRAYTPQEYLVNALRATEEVALQDLDEEEKRRALGYLDRSDPAHRLVQILRAALEASPAGAPAPSHVLTRAWRWLTNFYRALALRRHFALGVTVLFVGELLVKLVYVLVVVFVVGLGWDSVLSWGVASRIVGRLGELTWVDWAELASWLLSAAFVGRGVYVLKRARLEAFRWFERSVLVSILLTHIFSFYNEQFSALAGLSVSLLMLTSLRFVIGQERRRATDAAGVAGGDVP